LGPSPTVLRVWSRANLALFDRRVAAAAAKKEQHRAKEHRGNGEERASSGRSSSDHIEIRQQHSIFLRKVVSTVWRTTRTIFENKSPVVVVPASTMTTTTTPKRTGFGSRRHYYCCCCCFSSRSFKALKACTKAPKQKRQNKRGLPFRSKKCEGKIAVDKKKEIYNDESLFVFSRLFFFVKKV